MGIMDIACYITVGVPAEDMQDFEDMEQAMYQSFNDLANGFFSNAAENITEALRLAAENPLCISLVSCLLVVLAFHLIPLIFRIFCRRG